MTARVTLLPSDQTVDCADQETVFFAAKRAGIPIPTACMGKGTCGLCRVKVVSGEEHASPYTAAEKKHLGNTYFVTKLRLSCQLVPSNNLTVEIPDAPPKKRRRL
jgi:ferredoxin